MQYYCGDENVGLFVIARNMIYCCHCPKETTSILEGASIVLCSEYRAFTGLIFQVWQKRRWRLSS